MSNLHRSLTARLALLIAVVPTVTGCDSTQHVALGTVAPAEITGITKRSGERLTFASKGAFIERDTLYAAGTHGQIILPADSIRDVWVRRYSGTTTAITVISVVAVLGVLFAVARNKYEHCAIGPNC